MYPRVKLKTAVARPAKSAHNGSGTTANGSTTSAAAVVGDACFAQAGAWTVSRPVVNGIVQHWADMELLWHEAFENQLKVRELAVLPQHTPAFACAHCILSL